jgi:membrane fusion protein (multidrug efflux system)
MQCRIHQSKLQADSTNEKTKLNFLIMNRGLRITVTVLIIVLIAGTIAYPKLKPFLVSNLNKDMPQVGPIRQGGGQKLFVTGYVVKPSSMSDLVNTVGTIKPDEEVDLAFETSGKIVSIFFKEGTKVKKGDLLAKINDRPLQAQLQKLLVQKKLLESKEFRQRSLLDKDAISQESYDQIQTELQATVADINLVNARISETEMRAPFEGYIGLRYLSEGAYVTQATKIARLVKLSPLKIEFAISEKYTSEVKVGYPVTFKIDGIDNEFNAEVYAVDTKIDNLKQVVMRALYPNKKEELKSGRYASVSLVLSKIGDALAIPSEALIPEMEGERVFVYRGGKASSVKVNTGLRTESQIQITSGLKPGDTLIVTGILQLRQGLPVQLDSVIIKN